MFGPDSDSEADAGLRKSGDADSSGIGAQELIEEAVVCPWRDSDDERLTVDVAQVLISLSFADI